MSGFSTKKSLSRQLEEESRRVKDGKSPEKRARRNNLLLEAEAVDEAGAPSTYAHEDEDEEVPVTYVFTHQDSEGEERASVEERKTKKRSSGPRKGKVTGASKKIKANVILDAQGPEFDTADGVVKVNVAKYIMRPVTADDLAGRLKGERVGGKPLTTDFFECVLWNTIASSGHKRFKKVGSNTGNLMKHCDAHHQPVLDGIYRLIEECSSKEVHEKIKEYVSGARAPSGRLDRFFNRKQNAQISQESLVLLFFLDANIPFTQIDNEYFRELMRSANIKVAKSETIVESLLPAVYRFCMEEMMGLLRKALSFFTSFDGWSRFNSKFISQNYHFITMEDFSYKILMMDMIPYQGQKFAENVAGLLSQRQEHWTKGMDIVAAGGMADGESKIQKGGKIMYGEDDMGRCQNHALKGVYDEGERLSPIFAKDLEVMAALATAAHTNGNIIFELEIHQRANGLAELHLLMYNVTRWEGRKSCLERAIEMKESLQCLLDHAIVLDQRKVVPDFLEEKYFHRLRGYLSVLTEFDHVGKLYQSQGFPTGCFVPLCTKWLLDITNENAEEPLSLRELKAGLRVALLTRLKTPILGGVNLFLKAGLLHPGVGKVLLSVVSEKIIDACFESMLKDATALSARLPLVRAGLEVYRAELLGAKAQMPVAMPWAEMKKDGTFGGFNHIDFWKTVTRDTNFHEGAFAPLKSLAGMLLAAPAGESVDEFCFSSSQRTLSKDRNALSGPKVEQITVIRMFIRNLGLTPLEFERWLKQMSAEYAEQKDAQKVAERFE
jgi:hypothetical protein